MASAHVAQGARLSGHGGATGTSGAAVGPNAGGSAFDAIRPAIGGSAMSDGQAGDLELNAVDGCGCHGCGCFLCVLYRVRGGSATPYMHENPDWSSMV